MSRSSALVAVLLLSGSFATVQAAAGIQITRDEAAYTFAQEMSFELEAQADRPIADVLLHFTIGSDGPRNRRIPMFEPGDAIHATHRESLGRGQVPPASEVTWWWTVTDLDGQAMETAPQTFRYLDQQFEWHSTAADDVRVWWYGAPESFATSLELQARAALADLSATMGATPEQTIHVVTYQSRDDMRDALVDRGATFESRLTTLGSRVAPDILLLLAGDGNPELHDVLRHELSHIVLHLRLGKEYVTAPAWLDEGLAMYVEGELAPDEADRLARAMRDDELLSFRSLTTFPGQAELVPLAYAESRDAVAWLLDTRGQTAFGRLLDALASGRQDTDGALRLAYGADQQSLYEAYRTARGLPPPATPAPGQRRIAREQRWPMATLPLVCGASVLSLLAIALLAGFVWLLARRPRSSPPGA